MFKKLLVAVIGILLLYPQQPMAQQPPKKKHPFAFLQKNRYDRNGLRHGRWKLYGPDERTVIRKGRFRHGRETGKWRYYDYRTGALTMLERHKRNQDIFQVERYHPNGKLARAGQAKLVDEGDRLHYFWFGEWQIYNEQGQYTHTEYYEKGKLIVFRD